MSWLIEMFSYSFMVKALVVGLAIAVVAALVGVTVVLRKNSMLGDGLAHTAFGAFAVATVLGVAPLWFAIPVVMVVSFLILHFSKNKKINGDAAIALLSAGSLAIGTMAISMTEGVNVDLNSYLFGSILSVDWGDVWLSSLLAAIVVILYVVAHHRIFAITFDEDFAQSIGVKVGVYDAIFAAICSAVVVLGMRLLGALLISSLIIFPAVIAMGFSKSFKRVVVWSVIISVVNFLIGLVLSYLWSSPTGATAVVVNLAVLALSKVMKNGGGELGRI